MASVEQTTTVEKLEAKLAAQRAQVRDLATMGAVITAFLEIDAVLSVTMDMALRLVDGEVGVILIEEDGELKPRVAWGVSDSFVRSLMYEDGLDLASYCFKRDQMILLSDLDLKSEGIVLDTVIAAPIHARQRCLGVMIVINKAGGGNYTDEDRDILEMLLSFVAVAVENSTLIKDKLKQQKVGQEMAIAKQIQETILPGDVGDIFGASIGAVYFPAREVGGDFYDILKIDERRFIVIIGDVSNKGVPAALIMSACSAVIKSILTSNPTISMSALAERVNDLMAAKIIKKREMFVTLFFCKFDLATRKLTYCNAGHMPGLFWDNREGRIEELSEGGPILGQFEGTSYSLGERAFSSRDRLFLFTDGLTEARDIEGNLFGRERAEQVFSAEIGMNPEDFCLRVKDWVDRFTDGAPEDSQDDFTIVQVRVD